MKLTQMGLTANRGGLLESVEMPPSRATTAGSTGDALCARRSGRVRYQNTVAASH